MAASFYLDRPDLKSARGTAEIASCKMAGAGQPNASLSSGPEADDRAYAAVISRAKELIPQLRERAASN